MNVIEEQKAEIERLTKDKSFATRKMMESKAKAVELQKQVDELTYKLANEHNAVITLQENANAHRLKVGEVMKQNSELQKQVDELKQENSILSITVEMHDKVEQQAIKDTAKEICDLILEHWEKKQFIECDWLRVEIAEKYGVEVE